MLLIQEVCQALTCSLREPGGPCTKSMEVQNLVWNWLSAVQADGIAMHGTLQTQAHHVPAN